MVHVCDNKSIESQGGPLCDKIFTTQGDRRRILELYLNQQFIQDGSRSHDGQKSFQLVARISDQVISKRLRGDYSPLHKSSPIYRDTSTLLSVRRAQVVSPRPVPCSVQASNYDKIGYLPHKLLPGPMSAALNLQIRSCLPGP